MFRWRSKKKIRRLKKIIWFIFEFSPETVTGSWNLGLPDDVDGNDGDNGDNGDNGGDDNDDVSKWTFFAMDTFSWNFSRTFASQEIFL